MIQFKQYRIFIAHSEHSQLRAESRINDLNQAKRYEEERAVNTSSIKRTDDPLWQEEINKYETEVYAMLEKIYSTAIGKLFFKILNPKTEIWIVPMPAKYFKRCYCAITMPLNYDVKPFEGYSVGHGDAYIRFTPNKDFQDDTLFHELIHAYRFSYNKFEGNHILTSKEYNTEEFLAMTMENIYLSLNGTLQLYFTYRDGFIASHPGRYGTKEEIYEHFTNQPEIIMLLKFFLTHEYLAMLAAHSLNAAFNPFRDYPILEKQALLKVNKILPPGHTIKQFNKYLY